MHIVTAQLKRTLTDPDAASVPGLTVMDEAFGEVYRLRAERVEGADGRPRGLVLIEPAAVVGSTETVDALLQLGLTAREADVTLAVLRGQSTMAIAAELVVSPHTVHTHLRNVFEKLGVNSRQQLATRLLSATS